MNTFLPCCWKSRKRPPDINTSASRFRVLSQKPHSLFHFQHGCTIPNCVLMSGNLIVSLLNPHSTCLVPSSPAVPPPAPQETSPPSSHSTATQSPSNSSPHATTPQQPGVLPRAPAHPRASTARNSTGASTARARAPLRYTRTTTARPARHEQQRGRGSGERATRRPP